LDYDERCLVVPLIVNVVELTIIYLALGAPLGVYYITSHPADPGASAMLNGTLNLILWPAYLGLFLYSYFHRPSAGLGTAEQLRREIEALAPFEAGEGRIFRDALARYIGLSEAVELPIGTSSLDGLAEINSLRAPRNAAFIARRRTRERLLGHRDSARRSLMELLPSEKTAALIAKLAYVLEDHAFPNELGHSHKHPKASPEVDPGQASIAA
jgi:hypothetical protein